MNRTYIGKGALVVMILDDPKVRAAHLLRRAGFGAPPALVAKFAALPYSRAVEMLLTFPAQTAPAGNILHFLQAGKGDGYPAIRGWWFNLMLKTRNPLQEKMTLFWHGHFATSDYEIDDSLMLVQNQFFRRNALAGFRTILEGITLDPAMMLWLDGADNTKGHPNENYSRELMELFTLGRVDPVSAAPNYSEDDVRAGAKIFTGWYLSDPKSKYVLPRAIFSPDDHYIGGDDPANPQPYSFLGVKSTFTGTGKGSRYTGDAAYKQAIDAILNYRSTQGADQPPSVARWIAYKLWKFFGYPLVSTSDGALVAEDAALVDRLAAAFYAGGAYDTKALVRAIFTAPEFVSDRAYRAVVKSPVELFVGSLREVGASLVPTNPRYELDPYIPEAMGQSIFAPPNVKGWDGGRKWVGAATLFARFNYAELLSQQDTAKQEKYDLLKPMKKATTKDDAISYYAGLLRDGRLSDAERAILRTYTGDINPSTYARDRAVRAKLQGLIHLLMATPQYQMN